jgi:hypothetical protein
MIAAVGGVVCPSVSLFDTRFQFNATGLFGGLQNLTVTVQGWGNAVGRAPFPLQASAGLFNTTHFPTRTRAQITVKARESEANRQCLPKQPSLMYL